MAAVALDVVAAVDLVVVAVVEEDSIKAEEAHLTRAPQSVSFLWVTLVTLARTILFVK